jgi:hypothetical protein
MKKVELNTPRLQLQKEKITDLVGPKKQHNSGAEASRPVPVTTHSLLIEHCG